MNRQFVYRQGRRIEVIVNPSVVAPRKQKHAKFVQVPTAWIEKLVGESTANHDLALLVLQLDFKHYRHPVKLSNEAIKHLRIHRTTKQRSLQRLAKLGLISVVSKPGSAPVVTIIR